VRGFFAFALAVLVAGCASTQSLTPQRGVALSPLVEMQLAGTREAPVPPAALRFQLQHPGRMPARLSSHARAKIGLWASDTNFNYLLGQDSTGRKTVTAIVSPRIAATIPLRSRWIERATSGLPAS